MREVIVADSPAVAEARRHALAAAADVGMGEVRAGELAIVVTELGTNLVKHGGGGRIVIADRDDRIELLALDRGAGIADVAASMVDGHSTAGTPGNGLGAARRLSNRLELLSRPGAGTAVFARLLVDGAVAAGADTVGAVVLPKPGEVACGDGWCDHEDAAGRTLLVVDGLGHGSEAALVAREAVRVFRRMPAAPPAELVRALHDALRHTRGGAVAVARIDFESRTVAFAGLGNIAGAVVAPAQPTRRMVSHNGTAGHNARKVVAYDYPCAGATVVMVSDGIASSWTSQLDAGLLQAHPMLAAGVLYRDNARGRDDATVVVARAGPAP